MVRDDSDDVYNNVNTLLGMTDWIGQGPSQKLPIKKLHVVFWFLWPVSSSELHQSEPFSENQPIVTDKGHEWGGPNVAVEGYNQKEKVTERKVSEK